MRLTVLLDWHSQRGRTDGKGKKGSPKTTLKLHNRCDWPPEGGCDGLVEPQWAEDEEENAGEDAAGGIEEARGPFGR